MLSPFCLADLERIRQTSLLREARKPFDAANLFECDGLLFAACSFSEDITLSSEEHSAAIDAHGSLGQTNLALQRDEEPCELTQQQRISELEKEVRATPIGLLWERLFWVIHEATVNARESHVKIPLPYLCSVLWDSSPPQHWRTQLRKLCSSLCRLQIWDQTESVTEAQLFLDVSIDAVGNPSECGRACPWRNGDSHEHLHASSGPAALGVLEGLLQVNEDGNRSFPTEPGEDTASINERWKEKLSEIGKTGQLTQIYLPAVLGETAQVRKVKPSGHRLLQVVIREATRPTSRSNRPSHWSGLSLAELQGNKVPDHRKITNGIPKRKLDCPFLDKKSTYVGFNGNGSRPGQGYKLNTWSKKAGYEDPAAFLTELQRIAELLRLIVVAINPHSGKWKSGVELEAIAKSRPHIAQKYYLRVYALTNFRSQWDEFFGWNSKNIAVPPEETAAEILALMARYDLNQSKTAKLLEMDRSHLSKLLSGKRKLKPELLTQLQEAINATKPSPAASDVTPVSHTQPVEPESVASQVVDAVLFRQAVQSASDDEGTLAVAQKYRSCGWSIVPQVSGQKKPAVKWASYQERQPTEAEVENWWQQFTDAGIALIAGPLSGVLVIDVDGVEAHNELVQRLGEEPNAPRVNSGSEDPHRYHLYFQHPDLKTKAKATPWHSQLEFRGNKGLLILPPSIHKSGNPYQWTEQSRQWTGPLPELPSAIIEALTEERNHRKTHGHQNQTQDVLSESNSAIVLQDKLTGSRETQRFLRGEFAEGPRWNDRLFKAACDLKSRGVDQEPAVTMLRRGAQPRDPANDELMVQTIESAYSKARNPSSI